jgi:DNA replication initiation complex subunit (GINS family)
MSEEVIQGEGFTVKDKRTFDREGKVREEPKEPEDAKETAKAERKQEGARKAEEQGSPPLPEVNFSSFILSLSSSALLHLGEISDPQSGEKRKDLTMAKQSIDIIRILKDKTVGNLTEEEQKLLDHLLYDLRMRFVKASEK